MALERREEEKIRYTYSKKIENLAGFHCSHLSGFNFVSRASSGAGVSTNLLVGSRGPCAFHSIAAEYVTRST